MEDTFNEKLKDIQQGIVCSKDYYRRYIQNCENPDTILLYHTEIAKQILETQNNTLKIIEELYELIKSKEGD